MNFKKKLNRPYIIAEIGSNFNQKIEVGYEMIERAKKVVQMQLSFNFLKLQLYIQKIKKCLRFSSL